MIFLHSALKNSQSNLRKHIDDLFLIKPEVKRDEFYMFFCQVWFKCVFSEEEEVNEPVKLS